MSATRPRRIVRRACLSTAAAVLLLASYVTSYPLVSVLIYKTRIGTPAVMTAVSWAYSPLMHYIEEDLPGAKHCRIYIRFCGRELQQAMSP